jgi:CcmD family protein
MILRCYDTTSRWAYRNKVRTSVKNFWYLFAAYTIIWTALFVYLFYLSQKNRELREELRELQLQVARHLAKKEIL